MHKPIEADGSHYKKWFQFLMKLSICLKRWKRPIIFADSTLEFRTTVVMLVS